METLRVGAEEHDRSVGRFLTVKQVEVSEQGSGGGHGSQRKASLPASRLQEPIDPFAREILQGSPFACGRVERRDPQGAQPVQVIDQAGVDLGREGTRVLDTAADQFVTGLADQLLHLR